MWWKLLLLSLYLVVLFLLSRLLEAVAWYEGGYLASRLLDPVSLSVKKLKMLLDQRGVSYAGVVEKQELTELMEASGECCAVWLCLVMKHKKRKRVCLDRSSLKSPLSSADFTIYAPGVGTLSYTVTSPLGRIQHLRTLLQL